MIELFYLIVIGLIFELFGAITIVSPFLMISREAREVIKRGSLDVEDFLKEREKEIKRVKIGVSILCIGFLFQSAGIIIDHMWVVQKIDNISKLIPNP